MQAAGKRDKRITIQRNVGTQEASFGTKVPNWQPVASRVHAEVQDELPSRSEAVQQGIRIATGRARVRMAYIRGILSSDRVVVHGLVDRVMQIVGTPAVLGRRDGIELMCEEYSTAGNP